MSKQFFLNIDHVYKNDGIRFHNSNIFKIEVYLCNISLGYSTSSNVLCCIRNKHVIAVCITIVSVNF